jgi:hypothetical protein
MSPGGERPDEGFADVPAATWKDEFHGWRLWF